MLKMLFSILSSISHLSFFSFFSQGPLYFVLLQMQYFHSNYIMKNI